jgi:exoribonuclease-2
LAELTELAYGSYTPATAWAVWLMVMDGLYFSGTPDQLIVHPVAVVEKERVLRASKAAEQAAWNSFLERLSGGSFQAEDSTYLQEVDSLARGQRQNSRVLKALGLNENPENAHDLLLKIGYWDYSVNPYPEREGVSTAEPRMALPQLPDEPRHDLTYLLALAIDDEGSHDPDDALSLEGNRLWVHIADVAILVPPDSPADILARDRGANLYLPDRTLNMLPASATEILGLGLADKSPALSFGIDLGPEGEVVGFEIVASWISVTRLTYEQAETQIDQSPLAELYDLAQKRFALRQENGAIQIELPEVKVQVVDDQVSIRPLLPTRSRALVQEAMLLAGEAVASFAIDNGIPIPFTYQEGPADDPPEATTTSEMFALRRFMKPSKKSVKPAPHAGLGMDMYVQATSPLRRYLDLVVHQQLRSKLQGEVLLDAQTITERIGAAMSVSKNVRWAERRSIEHWTLVYLKQNPDWEGEGIVVDKKGKRDVILIPALNLETHIYLQRAYQLDRHVALTVQDVQLAHLETHFRETERSDNKA